jgi:hypothetical protein
MMHCSIESKGLIHGRVICNRMPTHFVSVTGDHLGIKRLWHCACTCNMGYADWKSFQASALRTHPALFELLLPKIVSLKLLQIINQLPLLVAVQERTTLVSFFIIWTKRVAVNTEATREGELGLGLG